jgi:hypothetical protein
MGQLQWLAPERQQQPPAVPAAGALARCISTLVGV